MRRLLTLLVLPSILGCGDDVDPTPRIDHVLICEVEGLGHAGFDELVARTGLADLPGTIRLTARAPAPTASAASDCWVRSSILPPPDMGSVLVFRGRGAHGETLAAEAARLGFLVYPPEHASEWVGSDETLRRFVDAAAGGSRCLATLSLVSRDGADRVSDAVARLDEAGLLDRTLLVVVGLPNEETESRGDLSERVLRRPLLFHAATLAQRSPLPEDLVVDLIDVAPTVLDLAGAKRLPPDWMGRSLAPVLNAGATLTSSPSYAFVDGPVAAVVWRGWKLVRSLSSDRRELFHLDTDPDESIDRSGSDDSDAVKALASLDSRIDRLFARWKAERNARIRAAIDNKDSLDDLRRNADFWWLHPPAPPALQGTMDGFGPR